MYYEIPQPPPPENTGREIWKVIRLQLPIFLLYQVFLALIFHRNSESFLILDIFPLVIHWLVLLILMIVNFANSKKGAGLGYLISFILILVIGFGSCWGISGLLDHSH